MNAKELEMKIRAKYLGEINDTANRISNNISKYIRCRVEDGEYLLQQLSNDVFTLQMLEYKLTTAKEIAELVTEMKK